MSDVFTISLVHAANSYRRSPIEKGGLPPEHIASLCALKKREDLIIIRPDKGSGVVLLDRKDYNSKMDTILCENSKFVLDSQKKDCTKSVESSLSSLLNDLVKVNFITKELRSFLLSSGHSVPRLYGLPKTHKPDCPLRPISSMSGTPTHKTASWLAEVLQPVREFYGKFCVKDTFDFVNKIRSFNLNDSKMASFHIKSLFTSETIDIILFTIVSSKDGGSSRLSHCGRGADFFSGPPPTFFSDCNSMAGGGTPDFFCRPPPQLFFRGPPDFFVREVADCHTVAGGSPPTFFPAPPRHFFQTVTL